MTPQRHATADDAPPARLRSGDGHGLAIRRRPRDPARPIDYAALCPGDPAHGTPAEREAVAGYEAGYADGRRDAEEAAGDAERERTARVDRAIAALARSTEALRSAYEKRSRELESAVPRFAFELLEALFGREAVLAADPGREAVARALTLDESALPAVVRLHPGDAATVGDLTDLSPSRPLTVVADPTVEPGGALVEVGSTTIDSQLSPALERVRAVLVGTTGVDPR